MQQLLLDVFTPPRPSLANFLVGQNAQVMHVLKQLSRGELPSPFVYVWGPMGCGKSHLIKSVAQCLKTKVNRGGDRFVFKPNTSLLVIDDIGELTPYSQIQLFNAFNSNLEGSLPRLILLAGDLHPADMKLRDDLQSRIEAGLCLRIVPLSDDDKAQALQKIAQSRGLELSNEVTEYALRYFHRDMGSLTALLDGLDRFSLEQKKPVSVHLLRHWMRRRESLVVREHETRTI